MSRQARLELAYWLFLWGCAFMEVTRPIAFAGWGVWLGWELRGRRKQEASDATAEGCH